MKFKSVIENSPCYPVFGTENVKNGDFFDFVEKIISNSVKIVQLREKNCETKYFFQIATKIKEICTKNQCKLIINDRIDIVLAAGADGVHIGQSDIPYEIARKLLGNDKIIGLSLDYKGDLDIANTLDLDYVAINGIFTSNTKDISTHIWGVDGLKFAKKTSKHPVVAIGGINEGNVSQISKVCDGFAVISDICNANDPVAQINKLNFLFSI